MWATEVDAAVLRVRHACQLDLINNPDFYYINCFVLLVREISYLELAIKE